MNVIDELREERNQLHESRLAILQKAVDEDRLWTDEEKLRYNQSNRRLIELDLEIKDLEARERAAAERVRALVEAEDRMGM